MHNRWNGDPETNVRVRLLVALLPDWWVCQLNVLRKSELVFENLIPELQHEDSTEYWCVWRCGVCSGSTGVCMLSHCTYCLVG